MANLGVCQGAQKLSQERADWLTCLMADQDGKLVVSAWGETMAFDSWRRLAEIRRPTLVVAASNDQAVPIHHALIWTHPDKLMQVTDKFLRA